MEEMARSSKEKKLAWQHGHIRPFLFLVSMRPALRSQCASALGVPLLGTDFFGDAHKEAWALISTPVSGLAAQCVVSERRNGLLGGALVNPSTQPTWYHVLRRMLDRAQFGGPRRIVLEAVNVMEKCRSSQDTSLALLEKEALTHIGAFCLVWWAFSWSMIFSLTF
jgi:hypothetical protein